MGDISTYLLRDSSSIRSVGRVVEGNPKNDSLINKNETLWQ